MRVSTKGQVTIPQDIREQAGIGPGTTVEFEYRDGAVILRRCETSRPTRGGRLAARLRGSASVGMSTDEIMSLTRGEPCG